MTIFKHTVTFEYDITHGTSRSEVRLQYFWFRPKGERWYCQFKPDNWTQYPGVTGYQCGDYAGNKFQAYRKALVLYNSLIAKGIVSRSY